ncbi:filamin-B-like [Acropora millepora]|uniref:filamin-B-like n=1 Tax=Acropora millepora TaxID=45264 RepID=UPI0010FC9C19|nr:filamin-B-like [Acropora millepora]
MAFACKFMPVGQCFGRNNPQAIEKYESTQCSVSGEGLTLAFVGEPAKFILRTSGPDLLFLKLQITRMSKDESDCLTYLTDPISVEYECLGENLHSVSYYPKEEGEYHMSVTWKGTHVAGSPFVVKAVRSEALKISVRPEETTRKDDIWKLREDARSPRRQRNNK